jgi:tetratricopeptide (TPR) repeat protein
MATSPEAGGPSELADLPTPAERPHLEVAPPHVTLQAPRPLAVPLALVPGLRLVPDYELVQRLGRGGFGEVWKAIGPGGVQVALKFVRLDDDAGAIEQRALDLIRHIRHPNLLALFGVWQRAGCLILALELGDGTLLDRLQDALESGLPGIPPAELLEQVRDAARGLDHLHSLGVQHRDVKPHNLLLVGGGVKVADCGLAKLLQHTLTSNTGSLTPAYAAPECFNGQTSMTSDLYSLAVTYCQLRGGRLPFEGSSSEVMMGHVARVPNLTMLPEAERPAVLRALAKEPAERYPTCLEFVRALQQVIPTEPIRLPSEAEKDTAAQDAVTRPEPLVPGGLGGHDSREETRRTGAAALLACILGATAVLGGTASYLFYPHFDAPSVGREVPPPLAIAEAPRPASPPATAMAKPVAPTPDSPPVIRAPEMLAPPRRQESPVVTRPAPDPKAQAVSAYEGGRARLEHKEYEAAIQAFTQALQLDPSHVMARCQRGLAYLGKQDYPRAVEDLDRARTAQPSTPAVVGSLTQASQTLLDLGNAHLGRNEYDPAIERLSQAIVLRPDWVQAYVQRGRAHAGKGQLEQALADFDEALKRAPGLAAARADRAEMYLLKGDAGRAIADCTRALESDGRCVRAFVQRGRAHELRRADGPALLDYNAALALDAKQADVHGLRAALSWRQGNWDQALADYTTARQLDPKLNVTLPAEERETTPHVKIVPVSRALALVYLHRARAHREKGHYDLALADCTQALQVDAKDAEAFFNRAEVHLLAGDLRSAIADYSELLRRDSLDNPTRARAQGLRGLCRHLLRELDGAIADYSVALKLQPGLVVAGERIVRKVPGPAEIQLVAAFGPPEPPATVVSLADVALEARFTEAYIEQGDAARRENRPAAAIQAYGAALQRDARQPAVRAARGEAYWMAGDLGRAISDYRAARKLDAQLVVGWEAQTKKVQLAAARDEAGPTTEAASKGWYTVLFKNPFGGAKKPVPLKPLEEVTEMVPVLVGQRLAQALTQRGEGACRQSQYREAVDDLTEALELQPDLVAAHHHRALAYLGLSQPRLAEQDFAECVRLDRTYVRPPAEGQAPPTANGTRANSKN